MTAAKRLLSWYDRHGRDLPWRKTKDPYRILVSEIMLQQTQVARGLQFYTRWLVRFPDWNALAKATNAQVLKAWAGLGYNRRVLMLRDVARCVVADGVPTDEAAWRQLKGLGAYTAAAVALFSQGARTVPIDTNTRRVFSRLLRGIPYPKPSDDDALRNAVRRVLPAARHDDFIQATFDLATAVCLKVPLCASCPLRASCKAAPKFLAGRVVTPKAMGAKARERRHRGKPHPDRIYRGRILKLVRESVDGVVQARIGPAVDPAFDPSQDAAWLAAMLARLEKDGMIRVKGARALLA